VNARCHAPRRVCRLRRARFTRYKLHRQIWREPGDGQVLGRNRVLGARRSLGAERRHRIDARRPPCRNPGRDRGGPITFLLTAAALVICGGLYRLASIRTVPLLAMDVADK
jgi:hypothetical protein